MATTPTSIGPIGARQINKNLYVGESDLTTIQKAVTVAVIIGECCVVIPAGYTGVDTIAAVTGGSTAVFISDQRTTSPQNYAWNGTSYIPSDFNQLADIRGVNGIFSDSVSAQQDLACGQDLTVEGDGSFGGAVAIVGDVSAANADFTTCEVASSPVRTFANTPDGPGQGMVWPPDGIPVSLGDHWQSASIPPASLATWPATGIAVSTGTSWAAPIDPATVPRLNTANAFTGNQSVTGNLSASGTITATGNITGAQHSTAGSVLTDQELTIAFSGIAIGQKSGSPFGTTFELRNDNTIPASYIDSWGDLYINSGRSGVTTRVTGALAAGTVTANAVSVAGTMACASASITAAVNAATAAITGTVTANAVSVAGTMACASASITAAVNAATAAITGTAAVGSMTAAGGGSFAGTRMSLANNAITIGQQIGGPFASHGLEMRTDNSLPRSFIDSWGDLYINFNRSQNTVLTGTFYATAKNFIISHPLDDTKNLIHSTLEGPEFGVFYRGEGVTAGGWAELTLPDYFEALTRPEGRTVTLTALFEDEDEPIGTLAASRVKEGKFRVWSALPVQKFYWEVKAVRSDMPVLEVVTPKEESEKPSRTTRKN